MLGERCKAKLQELEDGGGRRLAAREGGGVESKRLSVFSFLSFFSWVTNSVFFTTVATSRTGGEPAPSNSTDKYTTGSRIQQTEKNKCFN